MNSVHVLEENESSSQGFLDSRIVFRSQPKSIARERIDKQGPLSDPAADRFMIESIEIENFRCFQHLKADDFGQFNIVVGSNAGGKTALLEALYLPGGGPDVIWKYFGWRGVPMPAQGIVWTPARWEALWRDVFFQFDVSRAIFIRLNGSSENQRELKLFFDYQGLKAPLPSPLPIPGVKDSTPISSAYQMPPVVFETKDQNGKEFSFLASINGKGEYDSAGAVAPGVAAFTPSTSLTNPVESADLFSTISRRNEGERLKAAIRSVYPDISDVSLEQSLSGTSLYCALPGVEERVPIGLVSTGISKLVQILLNIASTSGGVVIVDEIENGFYYKVLPQMWKAILIFCKEYKVQLFASTHSAECLAALDKNMQDDVEQFRLLRAEYDSIGYHVLKTFKGRDFDAALKTGVDPR